MYYSNPRSFLFLPYHRLTTIHKNRHKQSLMKDPSTLKLQTPSITRDLLAPDSLLPLAAFLLHSASSVPDSSRTHPKYLNSTHIQATSYIRESHTSVPPFRPLLHTNKSSHHCSQVFLRLTIQNLVVCIQEPKQSQLSPLFLILILIFTSFITASIYAFSSKGDMIHPYLSSLGS